jgi:iron-sulfur cluster assembly protein
MLHLTNSAIDHLRTLLEEKGEGAKGLRIFVEKGGCAGMQYGMTLDDVQAGDEVFARDGVKVIVDPDSAGYLAGATVDYADDLAGAGFRIRNPNAVRSCGCGTSFETTSDE